MPSHRLPRLRRAQSGFTLIEVLISILLFSFGILAMAGLQARAIQMSTDAQQRAEATFLADQLLARVLISDPANVSSFAHHPNGTTTCAPTGAASTNPDVIDWLSDVTATFPRVAADNQQIIVNGDPTTAVDITVRLCWKNSASDDPHTLEVNNRVQYQQ